MRKVLITGVAGFIGSYLALRFLQEGYEVVGVDDLSSGQREKVPAGVQFIYGNLASASVIDLIPVCVVDVL